MVTCQLLFAGLLKEKKRSVAHILEQLHRHIVHCCKLMDASGRVLALIQHIVHNWDWEQRACYMCNSISRVPASTPTQGTSKYYLARHGDLLRPLQRYTHTKARSDSQVYSLC